MRPLHALVLVLALAGLLAGAFLLLGDDGGRGRLAAPVTERAAERALQAGAQDLEAPDREALDERASAPRSPLSAPERPSPAAGAAKAARTALRGRVVDQDGAPLAGARVAAAPETPWARRALERGATGELAFARVAESESDAEGRFRLELADAQRALLALEAPAHAPYLGAFALRAGEEVDVGTITLPPGVVLAGRVVDRGGRGVEGARLLRQVEEDFGFDLGTREQQALAVTDASGRFRIDRLAPGPWALRVQHDLHPDRIERGSTARAGERQESLLIELEDGLAIRGRVLEAGAEALAELEIVATPARSIDEPAGDPARASTQRRVRPRSDGRFELGGLRAGESYRVQGRGAARGTLGFPGRGMTPVVVARPGAEEIELRLRPSTSLVLQVVDARSGEPIERFDAWADVPYPVRLRSADGARPGEHAEGRARFEDLPRPQQGGLGLRIEAVGYHAYERDDLRLVEGRENDLGTIRLTRAPILAVRVLDELDGRPLEGARVRLRPVRAAQPAPGFQVEEDFDFDLDLDDAPIFATRGGARQARTDVEGVARLTVTPGESATLAVRAKGYAPLEHGPFTPSSEPEQSLELRLGPGGSVLVRVVDPAGLPVAGVGIEHRGPDGQGDGPALGGPRVTDAAGELRFSDLVAGTHAFRIGDGTGGLVSFAQGGAQINVVRRGGGEESAGAPWSETVVLPRQESSLQLVTEPRAEVRGRITEAGEPLAGATVGLSKAGGSPGGLQGLPGFGGPVLEARTDHEGRFSLGDVQVGRWRLAVRHAERAMPYEEELEVDAQGAEFVRDLPLVALRGTVRDSEGEPLAGVRVAVSRAERQERAVRRMIMVTDGGDVHGDVFDGDPSLRPALTDAEGRYELKGLVPDVELVVKASGTGLQPSESERVRLAPGEVREKIDLVLEAGGSCEVEVVDAKGEPAMGMLEARWSGEEGGVEPKSAFVGPSGRARLDGLRPGAWTVSLRPLAIGGGPAEPIERALEIAPGDNPPVRLALP